MKTIKINNKYAIEIDDNSGYGDLGKNWLEVKKVCECGGENTEDDIVEYLNNPKTMELFYQLSGDDATTPHPIIICESSNIMWAPWVVLVDMVVYLDPTVEN